MLRDVFKQIIAEQPDLEVVGDLDNGVDLLLAASQTRPDIVILGMEDSELPGVCSHLFSELPHIKLLCVTADGRQLLLYELRPYKILIGNASPQSLLDAIRGRHQVRTDPDYAS